VEATPCNQILANDIKMFGSDCDTHFSFDDDSYQTRSDKSDSSVASPPTLSPNDCMYILLCVYADVYMHLYFSDNVPESLQLISSTDHSSVVPFNPVTVSDYMLVY